MSHKDNVGQNQLIGCHKCVFIVRGEYPGHNIQRFISVDKGSKMISANVENNVTYD